MSITGDSLAGPQGDMVGVVNVTPPARIQNGMDVGDACLDLPCSEGSVLA